MNNLAGYLKDPRVMQFIASLDKDGQNLLTQPSQPNFIRNESTGNVTNLGPSQPSSGMQFDYASGPVDVVGVGKGYRLKNDPMGVYDTSGKKIADIRVDTLATRKRLLEDLNIAGKRQDVQKGLLENEEKLRRLSSGLPPGVSLNKGERWNPETQSVEMIPGSSAYLNQSGKSAKDLDTLMTAKQTADLAKTKIDEIMGDSDIANKNYSQAFQSNFGGYNAYLSQYLPGDATDVRKKIESLKSNLKTAGLQMMRQGGSIGQMTEKEWPIVEQAISSISPAMSEEEAALQLAKIKTYMDNMVQKAQDVYSTEWGGTQFDRSGQSPALPPGNLSASPKRISSDAEYNALPSGASYIAPDGSRRTKR